jgi:UDP:flavonoid glycosyltransferase YjiC (YdhE family)
MPDHVHFIGPLLPDMSRHATTPDWWDEMVNSEIPVVHVSQGTIATDVGDLITPTIYALADMNVLVIVSSRCIPPSLMDELPSNVRTAEFLPYDQLMKHVDVFVTNGGYGGVHFALSEGVPLVVAGATEDKPEVANRIEWSGAGINLRTNKPNLHQIRRAVKRSIRQPIFRQKAQAIKEQIEKLDAAEEAARLIESVVSA